MSGPRKPGSSKIIPTISLPSHLKATLEQGHPWVYREQIERSEKLPAGSWVRIRCRNFEAIGLWDDQGPIAVRLFSRSAIPDADWIARRTRQAWELREPIRRNGTNAYRWIYGEGDGLPSIVVDLYADHAVIIRYSTSTEALLPWLVRSLRSHADLRGIVERRAGEDDLHVLWGKPPPRDLTIKEHGLSFRANLYEGQKTGLFLDQRENRHSIEPYCAGMTVLNCFAYTGGFSVYALRGGAKHVVTCDLATPAIEDARRNVEMNGFDVGAHDFLVADAFELLEGYRRDKRAFDLIILDPPSFARAKKSRHAAVRAYTRLNQRAVRCVNNGGLLATSSCTTQVSAQMFRDMLAEAGRLANRRLVFLHEAGQPSDHPVPAGFPEGRYLKFIVAQVTRWP